MEGVSTHEDIRDDDDDDGEEEYNRIDQVYTHVNGCKVYLSGLSHAMSRETLDSMHISRVLSVCSKTECVSYDSNGADCLDDQSQMKKPDQESNNIVQMMIDIKDCAKENILSILGEGVSFIEHSLENSRNVLVHCFMGVSRSPTMVAAFLMHTLKVDPSTAIKMIRERRPIINPNIGFLKQLNEYHQKLNINKDPTS